MHRPRHHRRHWPHLAAVVWAAVSATPAQASPDRRAAPVPAELSDAMGAAAGDHSVASGSGPATPDHPSEPWLQGPRLDGVVIGHDDGPRWVEARRFRGDRVHAITWTRLEGRAARVLAAADLVGLHWVERRCRRPRVCRELHFRVAAVGPDPSRNTMAEHGDNRDLALYRVEYADRSRAGGPDWRSVCPAGPDGVAGGLFVNGRWSRDGAWRPGGYTFSCTTGAIAKCARDWGYKPWKRVSGKTGRMVDLHPLHLACVRALRADYCGDGRAHTRAGIAVLLSDRHGLNLRRRRPGVAAEAEFGSAGAIWVHHRRVPEVDAALPEHPGCERAVRAGAPGPDPDELIRVWSSPRR
ncbi:ADYC domain-containing protein [Haliangium sp.]|uniref:ADYC domain-containing protein n=1 Tax=Haliangium sp. TaxID=2663208 RepID=UPI003D0A841B